MKIWKRAAGLLLALLMLVSGIAVFAAEEETQVATEPTSLSLPGQNLTLELPAEYYYCYADNIEDYKEYFESIGWNYRQTVRTMKKQGMELFAFQNQVKEFYVTVDDSAYEIFGGTNLKELNEEDKSRAVSTYTGQNFNDYSMYDRNSVETLDTDQAWYVVSTFLDYTEAQNPIPVAEYWTVLNGNYYRFMFYGITPDWTPESCLTELEGIMKTVQFTEILTSGEVDQKIAQAKRAETVQFIVVSLSTLAAVAIVILIIVFSMRRKNQSKAKKDSSSVVTKKTTKSPRK